MRKSHLASIFLVYALACACSPEHSDATTRGPVSISVEGVASWKGAARAAYTIGHDDACEPTTSGQFAYAEQALAERNLRAAFGAIVSTCERLNRWAELNRLLGAGHEVLNHSWSHKSLVQAVPNFELEVANSKRRLDAELIRPTEFFIFPMDEFDSGSLDAVKQAGHLGARAGERGVNEGEVDPFGVRFDVYGQQYSVYANDPVKGQNILDALVDDAVTVGGWAFRELHGVQDGSWESVPLAEYTKHLDHVASLVRANSLWVDGPTAIIRYRQAIRACGTPVVTEQIITFPDATAECLSLGAELSVVVDVRGTSNAVSTSQSGMQRPTREIAPGRFVIDVSPVAGAVTLAID